MTKPPFRLIAFDCDGTLVDSQHGIVAAMAAAFARHGLPSPAAERVRRVVGLSLENAVQMLLPTPLHGRTDDVCEAYREAFYAQRIRPDHHEPLFPGTLEALDGLDHPEVFLAVCTGKNRRGLTAVLERHGLSARFHSLQTADVAPSKPAPDMVLRAMDETGVAPEETVVVGDTTFDMEMALNAGATAVGVGWGYHEAHELDAAGAHRVIRDFAELSPTLAELRALAADAVADPDPDPDPDTTPHRVGKELAP